MSACNLIIHWAQGMDGISWAMIPTVKPFTVVSDGTAWHLKMNFRGSI